MTYERLRALVVSGALDPEQRVSESSLAASLQVSRTPVREALQRLEADGLVFASGRGVRIRVLTATELADLLEARGALESAAAVRLATSVNSGEIAPARLAELDALAEQADDLTRAGHLDAAVASNRRFHLTVADLAGNTVISQTLTRLWDQLEVATRAGLNASPRIQEVDADHRQLITAIRGGNPDRARAAVLDHIARTHSAINEETRP